MNVSGASSLASSLRPFGAAGFLLLWGILVAVLLSDSIIAADSEKCIVLTGLGGIPEFEENFEKWADEIEKVCREGLDARVWRLNGREIGRTEALAAFQEAGSSGDPDTQVWAFLIGHGSYDGRDYKFNIKGPDLTGRDLRNALALFKGGRLYLVIATSSSGEVVELLRGPDRVVVSATRSGREWQAPLFMSFFVEAVHSPEADSNKDRRISLSEAFTFSASKVESWYREEGRLQTEHPVLAEEDSQPLASLAYLSFPPEQAYRTLEAQQLAPGRIRLERQIEALKLRKAELEPEDYYRQLEQLLVSLAELNQRIKELEGGQ